MHKQQQGLRSVSFLGDNRKCYLRCRQSGGAAHGILHLSCLHVKSLKLLFKLVHQCRDLCRNTVSQKNELTNRNFLKSFCAICCKQPLTFSRFMLFSVASIDFTTPDMDFDTWENKTWNKLLKLGCCFPTCPLGVTLTLLTRHSIMTLSHTRSTSNSSRMTLIKD